VGGTPLAHPSLRHQDNAEDREHVRRHQAVAAFEKAYGAKWPKAVKKFTDDVDELLAFHDFPAGHCVHLPTTSHIESTFATVRLPTKVTKVTKGAGSAAADLAMVLKPVESPKHAGDP
jgi:transposase-like protein